MHTQQEQQYFDLLSKIMNEGNDKSDRTGTGTRSIFGAQMRFDLSNNSFPLLTTKKVFMKGITHELLWFLSGDTNKKYLVDNGVHIWDEWLRPYDLKRETVIIKKKPKIKKISIDKVLREVLSTNNCYQHFGVTDIEETDSKLFIIWELMMRRCYVDEYKAYYYGSVSVHKDWHDPFTFIREVKEIPHWEYKLKDWNNFELDKDYYGSNCYSKENCVWIHRRENNIYSHYDPVIFISKETGQSKTYLNCILASEENGGNNKAIRRIKFGLFKLNRHGEISLKSSNRVLNKFVIKELELEKDELLRLKIIENGDLGPVYGYQWRNFNSQGLDQIQKAVDTIKNNPDSRRNLVITYNPIQADQMALPPCHMMFQFYVANGKLSCQMYQRSADMFLGVPFNIASYSLLVIMMAHVTGLKPGEFIHTIGDAHIYNNHFEQVKEQLSREGFDFPKMKIGRKVESIFDFKYEDFILEDYQCHATIKAPISV